MVEMTRREAIAMIAASMQTLTLAPSGHLNELNQACLDGVELRRDTGSARFNALQLALVNLRFGMFVHFSPTTYLDVQDQLVPDHAPPRQGKDDILYTADDLSPGLVSPSKLDCTQWASVAVSAKMRFGVLTAKHHDGFCLWPSKVSSYTVAQGCRRDIVGEFASAFRLRGLRVGLYYSVRDRTERIAGPAQSGGVSSAKIELIKSELSELLQNYGDILYIVFDGWGNPWHESPTFSQIDYADIREHVKTLQPKCLVLNHTRIRYVTDVPQLELRAGMGLPEVPDWPAVGGNTLQETWFWRKEYSRSALRSVDWIVKENLVPDNLRNIVFQLNCAPNRDGKMDENVVARMAEVGEAWTPPPDLETVPSSWRDWPLPRRLRLFKGRDIARGVPVKLSAGEIVGSASYVVDGDPDTFVELPGPNRWLEIDLGKICALAGLHLWNTPQTSNVMLERGLILLSDKAFVATELKNPQRSPGVECICISEALGYPTPFRLGKKARYVRIQSIVGLSLGLGEVQVFAR